MEPTKISTLSGSRKLVRLWHWHCLWIFSRRTYLSWQCPSWKYLREFLIVAAVETYGGKRNTMKTLMWTPNWFSKTTSICYTLVTRSQVTTFTHRTILTSALCSCTPADCPSCTRLQPYFISSFTGCIRAYSWSTMLEQLNLIRRYPWNHCNGSNLDWSCTFSLRVLCSPTRTFSQPSMMKMKRAIFLTHHLISRPKKSFSLHISKDWSQDLRAQFTWPLSLCWFSVGSLTYSWTYFLTCAAAFAPPSTTVSDAARAANLKSIESRVRTSLQSSRWLSWTQCLIKQSMTSMSSKKLWKKLKVKKNPKLWT